MEFRGIMGERQIVFAALGNVGALVIRIRFWGLLIIIVIV